VKRYVAFAENLAEILRDDGAEVAVSEGGSGALELARTTRFDALVTDMRMPVMSGARLVHEIRRVDAGLPAVVVTAYTGENDLQAAREEGLLAVLPKPVPLDRLSALVRAARRDGLVALIEDDPALADNLAEALRERGFSAVMAHSLSETERLGGVQPFAALVDLRLPGGPDGAALKRLRERFPALPVLIMSAHAEALAHVTDRPIFVKPFDTAMLLRELEKLWR
jgi:two-component system, response regulator PdtaR